MIIQMYEKEKKMFNLYMYLSPIIVLIALILGVLNIQSNKNLTIVSFLVVLTTLLAVYFVYTQSKKAAEVSLSFKEGYFVFVHPEYFLIFPPTAVEDTHIKINKAFVHVLFVLNPTKVTVKGSDLDVRTIQVKMSLEKYEEEFLPFYSSETTGVQGLQAPSIQKAEKQPKKEKEKKQKVKATSKTEV